MDLKGLIVIGLICRIVIGLICRIVIGLICRIVIGLICRIVSMHTRAVMSSKLDPGYVILYVWQ